MKIAGNISNDHTDLRRLLFTNMVSKTLPDESLCDTIVAAVKKEVEEDSKSSSKKTFGAFEWLRQCFFLCQWHQKWKSCQPHTSPVAASRDYRADVILEQPPSTIMSNPNPQFYVYEQFCTLRILGVWYRHPLPHLTTLFLLLTTQDTVKIEFPIFVSRYSVTLVSITSNTIWWVSQTSIRSKHFR